MLRIIFIVLLAPLIHAGADPDPARFAKAIDAFDRQDAKSPPEKGGVVFTGSSSIRMLDIPKYFPGLKALNRGFGGSHISEVNHYLERCVLRYDPSTVVLYCGGNDLWDKKSADEVEEDFNEFTKRLFERCPKAELIVLAIRPCPARKSILEIEKDMNNRFEKIATNNPAITYVAGTADRFINKDESFDLSLFAKDKLHMSAKGYEIWQELLTPLLMSDTTKKPVDPDLSYTPKPIVASEVLDDFCFVEPSNSKLRTEEEYKKLTDLIAKLESPPITEKELKCYVFMVKLEDQWYADSVHDNQSLAFRRQQRLLNAKILKPDECRVRVVRLDTP